MKIRQFFKRDARAAEPDPELERAMRERLARLPDRNSQPQPDYDEEIAELDDDGAGFLDDAEAGDEPARAGSPRPVVLVRKRRERERDWSGDASWLGGRPKLGNQEWPRGQDGRPLVFLAQIDCAELAEACPEAPLPRHGSLAFFLQERGGVIHVPPGYHAPTDPPADLPPAHDEGGDMLPAGISPVSRQVFPQWPVEPVALPLPPELRDYDDQDLHDEILAAQSDLLAERGLAAGEDFSVAAAREAGVAGADLLCWYGVQHLVARLHEALNEADHAIAMARASEAALAQRLERLEADETTPDGERDAGRAQLETYAAVVAEKTRQHEELPGFIADVEAFAAYGNGDWAPLSDAEKVTVARFMSDARDRFGYLVSYRVPCSIDYLADVCVRRMLTGGANAMSALPEPMLEHVNERCRMPSGWPHMMFGLGNSSGAHNPGGDLLLLQIGYDGLMEWRFDQPGAWQFRMTCAEAAAGRWEQAVLTFEPA